MKSNLKGVYFVNGKWAGRIFRNYESVHVGYYPTPELAQEARVRWSLKLFGSVEKPKRWCKIADRCKECRSDRVRHGANGYCENCWKRRKRSEIRLSGKGQPKIKCKRYVCQNKFYQVLKETYCSQSCATKDVRSRRTLENARRKNPPSFRV